MSKGTKKYFKKKIFWFIITLIAAVILNFILPRLMRGGGTPMRIDPVVRELALQDSDYLSAVERADQLKTQLDEKQDRLTTAQANLSEIAARIAAIENYDETGSLGKYANEEAELTAARAERDAAKEAMDEAEAAKLEAEMAVIAATNDSTSATEALDRANANIEAAAATLNTEQAAQAEAQAQFDSCLEAFRQAHENGDDDARSEAGRRLILASTALAEANSALTSAQQKSDDAVANIEELQTAADETAAALEAAQLAVEEASAALEEASAAYNEVQERYQGVIASRLADLSDDKESAEAIVSVRTASKDDATTDYNNAVSEADALLEVAYDKVAADIAADLNKTREEDEEESEYAELIRNHIVDDDAYTAASAAYDKARSTRDAAQEALTAAQEESVNLLVEINQLRGRMDEEVTASNEAKAAAADTFLASYEENPEEAMATFETEWAASDEVIGPLADKEERYAQLQLNIEELQADLNIKEDELKEKTAAKTEAEKAAYDRIESRLKANKTRSDVSIIALLTKSVSGEAMTNDSGRNTWVNTYDNVEKELGRDGGMLGEFWHFVQNIFNGTFGKSTSTTRYPKTVASIISEGIVWTLCLQIPAILIGWILGNLLGAVAAYRRKIWDKAVMPASLFISAIPAFGSAVILLVIFGVNLKWFPVNRAYDPGMIPAFTWSFIGNVMWHYQLPFWSIVLIAIGGQAVGMRSMSIYELNADYVKYSRFLGIKDGRIVRYVFRNAMLPQVTGLAMSIGTSIGGALVAETIFSYPGLGMKMYAAISENDYNTVSGIALIITIMVLIAAFLLDIIYAFIDPRVKAAQFD